ncbi:MAG: T9SS type A sorting domain-containing protein [Vicingaceae bacterium]
MKNQLLLTLFIFLFSQTNGQNKIRKIGAKISPSVQNNVYLNKVKSKQSKAPGFVFYSEDFSSGGPGLNQLPVGWTVSNGMGNSNNWIWSNAAPGGQYSASVGSLNSTTGSNGFLSLPSGFYNTVAPPGGFVGMDASVSSPPIPIDSTIADYVVEWEQAMRYCCVNTGDLVLEVSSDGVNWDAYDAREGRGPNDISPNAETIRIVVSQTLGLKSTAYLRFRQSGSSHYYWMIDDLKLIEGGSHLILQEENILEAVDTFDSKVLYTQVPHFMAPDLKLKSMATNAGSQTQTNAYLHAKLFEDTNAAGVATQNLLTRDSSFLTAAWPAFTRQEDSLTFALNSKGSLRLQAYFQTDSFNQGPSKADFNFSFKVGDTVLARDRGVFSGATGPPNIVGGGNDGDRWGVLFNMAKQSGIVNSLSIYVANDSNVIGSLIKPVIWEFNNTGGLGGPVFPVQAQNTIPTTITAAMMGTWIRLPLNSGNPVLQNGKQYVMGWEQVGGESSGKYFLSGRDQSMEPFAPNVSNFVYVNDAAPAWSWVSQVAGVRANFLPQTVGLEDEAPKTETFKVYPNPSQGNVKLKWSQSAAFNTIEIRNLEGKTVKTDELSPSQNQHKFELGHLSKAVYYIILRGENTQSVQKLVLY